MKLKRPIAVLSALCMMLTTANGGAITASIIAGVDNSVKAAEKSTETIGKSTDDLAGDGMDASSAEDSPETSGSTLKSFSSGTAAKATEALTSGSFTYIMHDEQVTITGYDTSATGEVVVPETIEDYPVVSIGDSAFSECERITSVTIPISVISIGNYAFQGCVSLDSIALGGIQKIGYNVFEGCTALTSLTIPNTLTECEEYSYYERAPLAGSSITSVTFEEGIANIPAFVCYGASSLVNVFIPEKDDTVDGYIIGEYAFYGCPFLNEINIPNSITGIGGYAFANCSNLGVVRLPSSISALDTTVFQDSIIENVQISKEDSPVALVLIDNEIQYTADETGIKDSTTKYLDRSVTDYRATASSVSAAGMVTLAIDYDFKSNAKNLVSDMSIKIKLPSAVAVTSGSVRIDGTAVDYSESNGYLIIPVENKSGSVRFTVEPNDAVYLLSYAQMTYNLNGASKTETIGIVNMATKLLTINVPNETSSKLVHVTGVTSPRGEVSIYVDDELVETCTASAVGNYSADVVLKDVSQGTAYKIEAKTFNSDGSEISVLDYVTYNTESVKLTKFNMYFRNNEYDLIQLNGSSPVISWASNSPFTFVIDFDNCENIKTVTVVSEKANGTETLEAVYDKTNDYFVATGFSGYVPGTISVEYTMDEGNAFENAEISFVETYAEENVSGYKSKVFLEDTEFYFIQEIEENATLTLTDNFIQTTYDGKNGYMTIEPILIYRNDQYAYCQEFYNKAEDGSYTVTRFGFQLSEESDASDVVRGKSGDTKLAAKAADVVDAAKALKDLNDLYDKVNALNKVLNTRYSDDSAAYTALEEFIDSTQSYYDTSSSEYWKLEGIKNQLKTANLIDKSSKNFGILADYIDNSVNLSDDPGYLMGDKWSEKFGSTMDQLEKSTKRISNKHLQKVYEDLFKGGFFGGNSYIENLAYNLAEDAKKGGATFKGNYAIDPSGYVYEGVTSNRVSGVKATIYYKETEDSEAIMWDATEYDQINPLYSDEDGAYAWDVPEGLWQVEFVKDGYETAYSDWLPVPPEQLEVNVEMISTSAPGIEFINAYNNEIQIVFDQYVDISTVNKDTVTFTLDGETVTGIFDVVNGQTSASDSSVTLATVFDFIPYDSISGKVDCTISNVTNYAGNTMASEFTSTIEIVKEIGGLKADSSVTIPYQGSGSVTVQATPGDAAAGKTLLLSCDNTFLISVPESVTFDDSGTATIPVDALLPGEAAISYTVEGTTITGSITVVSTIDDSGALEDNTRIPGDTNGDGEVTITDAILIRRYIVGGWNDDIDEASADVNGDSAINLKDVVLICRYIVDDWDVTLQLSNHLNGLTEN